MGDTNRPVSPRVILTTLLADKGYRDSAVLGPFTGGSGEQQYAVTIHDQGGEATRMLRGSFAELWKALRALPTR
jgi:hypothetical protein